MLEFQGSYAPSLIVSVISTVENGLFYSRSHVVFLKQAHHALESARLRKSHNLALHDPFCFKLHPRQGVFLEWLFLRRALQAALATDTQCDSLANYVSLTTFGHIIVNSIVLAENI